MKLYIDETLCSGHGRCYTLSPQLLEPNDEGFPNRLGEEFEVPPGLEADGEKIVANCPEGAIRVTEA